MALQTQLHLPAVLCCVPAADVEQVSCSQETFVLLEKHCSLCCVMHVSLRTLLTQVCLPAVMAATLLSISLVVERLWAVFPGSPYFASLSHAGLTTLILAFGGCLGFMMVWVEFTVIQETSALTFMVAGTFKEIVTGALATQLR